MTTTVVCVWVKGHVPFTVEYVAKLRAMTAKHLARPHRFVCLTDRPQLLPHGVEPVVVTPIPGVKGWWAKLELFNVARKIGDRMLYLDLDTVVVDALDPIVDFPAPFALIPDAGDFQSMTHRVVKRFNSSVMVWDHGVNGQLFDRFSPAVAARYWGDQDAIGDWMPEAARMPLAWFPRLSSLKETAPVAPAKVVLAKVPKNHIAADLYRWFGDAWRAT